MGGISKRRRKGNNRAAQADRMTRRHNEQIRADLDDPVKANQLRNEQPIDLDKPGLGQYYCLECDRYFVSLDTLNTHNGTKKHKRRVKELEDKPYSTREAEAAAGMGEPDNGK